MHLHPSFIIGAGALRGYSFSMVKEGDRWENDFKEMYGLIKR